MQWVRGAGGFLWLCDSFFCLLALFFVSSSLVPLSLPHAMDFFHVPRERLLDCGATVYGVGGLSEENAKWEKNKKMFALFVCVCLVRYNAEE